MRVKQLAKVLLSGTGANGVTPNAFETVEYQNLTIAVTISAGFSAGTLKFQGSINDIAGELTQPNFANPASATNQWGYVQTVNLDTGATINGSSGLSLASAGTFLLEVNANGLSLLSAEISGLTGSGTIDVVASGYGQNR